MNGEAHSVKSHELKAARRILSTVVAPVSEVTVNSHAHIEIATPAFTKSFQPLNLGRGHSESHLDQAGNEEGTTKAKENIAEPIAAGSHIFVMVEPVSIEVAELMHMDTPPVPVMGRSKCVPSDYKPISPSPPFDAISAVHLPLLRICFTPIFLASRSINSSYSEFASPVLETAVPSPVKMDVHAASATPPPPHSIFIFYPGGPHTDAFHATFSVKDALSSVRSGLPPEMGPHSMTATPSDPRLGGHGYPGVLQHREPLGLGFSCGCYWAWQVILIWALLDLAGLFMCY